MTPLKLLSSSTGILVCCTLQAQDSTHVRSGWSLGASGSFDSCYRTLEITEDNSITHDLVEWRDDHEVQRYSYTAGVDVEYAFNDHWILASGIQFSDRGYGTDDTGIIVVDTDGSATGTGTVAFDYHYRFISFPFMARYSIGKGAWRFVPSVGVCVDRLHQHFSVLTLTLPDGSQDSDRNSDSYTDFNEWGSTACLELPVSVSVCDRVDLRFGPRARYQFTRLTNTPITDHLWEGGFLLGAMIRL